MITTKTDLKFYLQEDAKANRMDGCSPLKYMVRLFIGSESAHVYKYLKTFVTVSIIATTLVYTTGYYTDTTKCICTDWDSNIIFVSLKISAGMV